MTHEELLAKINKELKRAEFEFMCGDGGHPDTHRALCAVVELHKPEHSHSGYRCTVCFIDTTYPCATIKAIEKELNG